MALTQEDRDFLLEEHDQKIADSSASFGKGGINFLLEYTRGEADKVAAAIQRYADETLRIGANPNTSGSFQAQQITDARALIDGRLDQMVTRCEDKIQRAAKAAETKAALPVIAPAEEQLVALTAAQDVEARKDDERVMIALYQKAQEGGDRTRAAHLARLIEPRLTESRPEWEMLKLRLRTEAEVTRDETKAGSDSLRAHLPMLRSYLEDFMQDIKNVPDFAGLPVVLSQVEANVRRNASSPSAGYEAMNA
ncbi:MAG: hypothetical protein ACYDGS_08975 [Thermoleophilia bacterium]